MIRLAFLTSHPIQYQAPLFRKLASSPEIDLTVLFCSRLGTDGKMDPGFGVPVAWDVPLLEGYRFKFFTNFSPVSDPRRFWSFVNPSVIREIFFGSYDALIVHGYGAITNWLAFAGAKISGTPIILQGETVLHSDQGVIKRAALSQLFKQVSAFLVIGTKSREFYKAFGISDEKLFLAPYSVDNSFFFAKHEALKSKKGILKRGAGIPESLPVILYLSKLIARKRPMDLLCAFLSIQDKAALVFVGDGEERSALQQHVISRQIKNVFFTGFKNQTELPNYYSMADVFVLPSEFETWGLVVNEAMCFGLPIVVSSGVAASADLVRHGENGYVYSPGDIRTLTDYLEKLIGSLPLRQTLGKRSLEIISDWNHDHCVEGIRSALRFTASSARGFQKLDERSGH